MSSGCLLDTDTLSDLVRRPQGSVAQQIQAVGEDQICTGIVVAGELRFGAARSRSTRLFSQLERVLSAIAILPLEVAIDRQYAQIQRDLESAGYAHWPQ